MKDIRICTVVVGSTLDEFLKNLEKVQKVSDLIELRVDCIQDMQPAYVQIIKNNTQKEAIFTCRAKKQGGEFRGSLREQQEILQKACDLGFEHIDIDLEISDKLKIQNKETKIIISYHNFVNTPSFEELQNLAKRMMEFSPDIIKFAVMCNSKEDTKTLYRFLLGKNENEEMIVLGMGEAGITTRILCPLLGGYLTFASLSSSKSAPGQIELGEMKKIYKNLERYL